LRAYKHDIEFKAERLATLRLESKQCCVETLARLQVLKPQVELATYGVHFATQELEIVKKFMNELADLTKGNLTDGGSPFAGYDVGPLLAPSCDATCVDAAIDARKIVYLAESVHCAHAYEDFLEDCYEDWDTDVKELRALLPKIPPYLEFYRANSSNIIEKVQAKQMQYIRTHDDMTLEEGYLEYLTGLCEA